MNDIIHCIKHGMKNEIVILLQVYCLNYQKISFELEIKQG